MHPPRSACLQCIHALTAVVCLAGGVQAVAPGAAFGRTAGAARGRTLGRAGMLLMVCGLAACVALLGGLGDAEEPVSQAFLALKAELQSKPAAHVSGKVGAARPPACAPAPARPCLPACSPAYASRWCADEARGPCSH